MAGLMWRTLLVGLVVLGLGGDVGGARAEGVGSERVSDTTAVSQVVGPPTLQGPDLTITYYENRPPYGPPRPQNFRVIVRNVGTRPSPATKLMLKKDDEIPWSPSYPQAFYKTWDVSPLGAGSSQTLDISWDAPYNGAKECFDGIHDKEPLAIVDPFKNVQELKESNNSRYMNCDEWGNPLP